MWSSPWTRLGMVLAGAGLLVLQATCTGGGRQDPGTARIVVYLTDAPVNYDNVWVTLDDLAIHESAGGWVTIPLTTSNADTNGDGVDDLLINPDGSVTVDLLALQGVETLFASGSFGAGTYSQLRLKVVSAEAVEGGNPIPLKVPSGAQTGLKIPLDLTVRPGEVVTVLLDFDAEKSIVDRGGSGEPPILKPVISPVIQVSGAPATVRSWGWNDYRQLGDGTDTSRLVPVQVVDPSDPSGFLTGVEAVSAGVTHAMALMDDGTVRAWGDNWWAQLGDGTRDHRDFPVQVVDSTDPSGFLTGVAAVSAGNVHTVALLDDGTVRAWGWNANGQLGDGTTTQSPSPVQVVDPTDPSGFLTGVTAVAAGLDHSVALMDDGTVRAWGLNSSGQLGDGAHADSMVPVQVVDPTDPSGFLTGVEAVSGGGAHTVALMQDSTLRAWGSNIKGQLGDGTNTSSNVPVQVVDPTDSSGFLTGVASMVGGGRLTVALMGDATVRAWGANGDGQLGDGTGTDSNVPVRVVDPTDPSGLLTGAAGVAAGSRHSMAVMADATARAWGSNVQGQLGDGTTTDSLVPVQVVDPTDPSGFLTGAVGAAGGSDFSLTVVR